MVSGDNIILGGDLNLCLRFGESWGLQAKVDALSKYMLKILELHNLADVHMNKPLPTWRNRRIREASLARRLDRIMIKILLMQ